eukprot:g39703.t1
MAVTAASFGCLWGLFCCALAWGCELARPASPVLALSCMRRVDVVGRASRDFARAVMSRPLPTAPSPYMAWSEGYTYASSGLAEGAAMLHRKRGRVDRLDNEIIHRYKHILRNMSDPITSTTMSAI